MSNKCEILKILQENVTKSELETIKEKYKSNINSNRRYDEITNIQDLLEVLEDRQVLTNDNLAVVRIVVESIANLQGKEVNVDDYFTETAKGPVLSEKVNKLICTKYGDLWKELCDNLHVDSVNCSSTEDVLQKFQSDCKQISQQEMHFRLFRALEKCSIKEPELEVLLK